jgi:hypothetical protein
MERGSNQHGPRLDEAMGHEVESFTRGAPVEARAADGRVMEDVGDDVLGAPPGEGPGEPDGSMSRDQVRSRSELAQHLRPSVFPARAPDLVECASEERAPEELLARLRSLPASTTYGNVEQVWEALGGSHEERTHPVREPAPMPEPAPEHEGRGSAVEPRTRRFEFRFDRPHRLLGLPFRVTPASASVEIDRDDEVLRARFGPWSVTTPFRNIEDVRVTGPYRVQKTAGPAHVSLVDRGLTFATNDARGVCICFRTPVRGIDPVGVVRHPALTVTVADPDALRRELLRETATR